MMAAGNGGVSCDEQVSLLFTALYLHHLQRHFLKDWQRQHLFRMMLTLNSHMLFKFHVSGWLNVIDYCKNESEHPF